MLSLNFEPGDHELALSWFENESILKLVTACKWI